MIEMKNVKAITYNGLTVKKIEKNGVELWPNSTPSNYIDFRNYTLSGTNLSAGPAIAVNNNQKLVKTSRVSITKTADCPSFSEGYVNIVVGNSTGAELYSYNGSDIINVAETDHVVNEYNVLDTSKSWMGTINLSKDGFDYLYEDEFVTETRTASWTLEVDQTNGHTLTYKCWDQDGETLFFTLIIKNVTAVVENLSVTEGDIALDYISTYEKAYSGQNYICIKKTDFTTPTGKTGVYAKVDFTISYETGITAGSFAFPSLMTEAGTLQRPARTGSKANITALTGDLCIGLRKTGAFKRGSSNITLTSLSVSGNNIVCSDSTGTVATISITNFKYCIIN